MIFLEILLFTSKLILFSFEANGITILKIFCLFVIVCVRVHFQVILVWLRRGLMFAVMRLESSDSYFILSILTSWI